MSRFLMIFLPILKYSEIGAEIIARVFITQPIQPCKDMGAMGAPQSVDKRCRRSHGRVERLAMDGPLVSRYLTLCPCAGVSLTAATSLGNIAAQLPFSGI